MQGGWKLIWSCSFFLLLDSSSTHSRSVYLLPVSLSCYPTSWRPLLPAYSIKFTNSSQKKPNPRPTDRPQPPRPQRKGTPNRRRRSHQREGEEGEGGCESCQGEGKEEWEWEGVVASNYKFLRGRERRRTFLSMYLGGMQVSRSLVYVWLSGWLVDFLQSKFLYLFLVMICEWMNAELSYDLFCDWLEQLWNTSWYPCVEVFNWYVQTSALGAPLNANLIS